VAHFGIKIYLLFQEHNCEVLLKKNVKTIIYRNLGLPNSMEESTSSEAKHTFIVKKFSTRLPLGSTPFGPLKGTFHLTLFTLAFLSGSCMGLFLIGPDHHPLFFPWLWLANLLAWSFA
jgi:hypothetical protein